MNLIVDASIAYKWLVVETDSELALKLKREHDLVAPDLLLVECRNAALTSLRKGELTLSEASRVNLGLQTLPLPTIPSIPLLPNAFEIAATLRHPIYDCIYVAAAIATDRMLVTADKRFAAKVAASSLGTERIRRLDEFADV